MNTRTSAFTIRQGTDEDLADLVRVRTSVRENHLSVEQMAELGITPEIIGLEMAAGDLGCWVAEVHGKVAGFSMADRRDATVFALFVEPRHEGKGLGSALIASCETWLAGQGADAARLTTGRGTKAHEFYLRRGWKLTGEKSERFPMDDVFEKRIRASLRSRPAPRR